MGGVKRYDPCFDAQELYDLPYKVVDGRDFDDALVLLRDAYECGDRNIFGTDLDERIRAFLDKC